MSSCYLEDGIIYRETQRLSYWMAVYKTAIDSLILWESDMLRLHLISVYGE